MFQLRSMLAPGQRQPQGMEQRLALAAGDGLERCSTQMEKPATRSSGRWSAAAARSGGSVTTGASGRRQTSHHSRAFSSRSRLPRIASQKSASMPPKPQLAQPGRDVGVGKMVQHGGGEARQIVDHQPGGGLAVVGKVETGHELGQAATGLGGACRAQGRQGGHDRQGLDPLLAQAAQAQRTQPLGELATGGVGDQRQMGEERRGMAQAARIASCSGVLLTWSSPRMTWLMPSSASSTAEANR